MRYLGIVAILFSLPAAAQEMPPIDRDLWQALSQGLAAISMPLAAHQQAQQIIQGIEAEAAKRKIQKDAIKNRPENQP
jgi:hypothetical protein